jgi:murein DD-endopeptidase MepM/ murein hydrolase activator NlpD
MARIKYYYDTETCKYERVKVTTWDVVLNSMGFFTVVILLAVGLVFAYNRYFESPKEIMLKKENEDLKLYYDILNKELEKSQNMLSVLQERDDQIYRVIFEAEPIPDDIREAGIGGSEKYTSLIESSGEAGQVIAEAFEQVSKMKRQLYIQTKSYDEIMTLARNKEDMLAAIPAIQPVKNKELKRLASGFGMRIHPIYKARRMHYGIDFAAPRGTPIYATGDGIIKRTYKSLKKVGYGNQVEIDHGYGYVTKYAHMQDFVVKKGQRIKRGQLIGYVGSSGGSTAPHCHYEIIKDGRKVDPIQYIIQDVSDGEYEILLELASRENQSLG